MLQLIETGRTTLNAPGAGMTLAVDHHPEAHTTLFRASGMLEMSLIVPEVERQFQDFVADNIIWDVRGADASGLGLPDMKALAALLRKYDHRRAHPHGAGITSSGIARILAKLFMASNIALGRRAKIQTFDTLNEALCWLDIKEPRAEWLACDPQIS